ncbi:LuxR C-terminal-related transcriptional regulator [Photorhabdus laumondii]|uniref:Helix-turn-helix transcriptional regulator n=1 Tax=Photorhabdus laumondii subsp. clarkei TaxID=2029685 RepID=A0A329VE07_9GAMM|nr:LuxR C-terminal-related transcriptional regulator [Photorhabdus laumondii]PQQ36830.1 helix-turn-helix transcriptional regulator [Photorhabdus luminescens]RAW88743.1 helix-turn-helix transcriptional regulator [Photorhabdus laumondii subsp. clarkei]
MKILIVEECYYTRSGIREFLKKNDNVEDLEIVDSPSINEAINIVTHFTPDIVLANLTHYCHHASYCSDLQKFITLIDNTRIYIYLNSAYPYCDNYITLKDNAVILAKRNLTYLLNKISKTTLQEIQRHRAKIDQHCSIFSPQEHKVIDYWMKEIPNYQISQKLKVSNSTVYSHKRHITEKINVRNRIELCFIYNVFKYLY